MAARIVTPLIVRPLPGRVWEVMCPFVVETSAGIITVPTGFEFDGNSLPRAVWFSSTPADYLEAAAVHDYLYRTGALPRKTCDQVYREVLKVVGANGFRRFVRYWGLRIGGWGAYRPAPTA